MRRSPVLLALAALTAIALGLRAQGALTQSLWLDEDFTRVVVDRPWKEMLERLSVTESNPSLFYVLEWIATQVAGVGDRTLRLVPVAAGVATVPVAFLLGRRLRDDAAGLVLAALFAVHPLAVWYGVEARSYGLFLLLSLVSLLVFVRLLQEPGSRSAALWGVVAGAMIITHYFGAFIVAAQFVWLFWALPTLRRELALAAAAIAVVALAAAPLWAVQEVSDRSAFIAGWPLDTRLTGWLHQMRVGVSAPTWHLAEPVALGAIAAIGAAVYWAARGARVPTGTVAIAATGVGALGLSLLFAHDFVLGRNMIGLWPFAAALIAVGLASLPRPVAAVPALLIAVPALLATGALITDTRLQRPDFAGLAEDLGPVTRGQVVVVSGDYSAQPLGYYINRGGLPPGVTTPALEVVAVGADAPHGRRSCETGALCNIGAARPLDTPLAGADLAGLQLVERRRSGHWNIAVYRAERPVAISREAAGRLFDRQKLPQVFPRGAAP